MLRIVALSLLTASMFLTAPARATDPSPPTEKLSCANPAAGAAAQGAEAPASARYIGSSASAASAPKVLFKLNRAEDAPTILRFVTNYLAVEPSAKVAVVGYGAGIDFMLQGASDSGGTPYADQMAALAARGVDFKVCNNTLKARNLTAAAVSPPATVVPGAVNEIIRLQTREGYAYFQN
ncbi:MAG TPA: DsrE family protein [Burkholderiaceae bacterium]|nr:DsrE family protein [Burkholderiaceae bacterium]